ncbi:hypothetical protein [Vibrio spartinae]|nr:hypothetical protein [Vibrio spartinae]
MAAAAVSLYAEKIRDFSMPWDESADGINWYSVSFLIISFIAAVISGLSALVKTKQTDYWHRSYQTSPPTTFWELYAENIQRAMALPDEMQNKMFTMEDENLLQSDFIRENLEAGEKNIRIVLDMLIGLVKAWDAANIEKKVLYRANIMKVHYFEDDEIEPDYGPETGKFYASSATRDNYTGIISLTDNKLTTTTETKNPDPDQEQDTIQFAFTIYDDSVSGSKMFLANLEGAPSCVASGEFSYVSNTKDIPEFYKNSAIPYHKGVYSALEEYYNRPENPAHSMLSIPLYEQWMEGDHEGNSWVSSRVGWVLNIYRNQSCMLYDGDKCQDYCHAASAFITILEKLLMLYNISQEDREFIGSLPQTLSDGTENID